MAANMSGVETEETRFHPALNNNNNPEEEEEDEEDFITNFNKFIIMDGDDQEKKRGAITNEVCEVDPIEESGLGADDTWDYSLKTGNKGSTGRSIWITERDFAQRLTGYDSLRICDHDVIKINCPCPASCKYSICSKCHITFCSNKCVRFAKEQTEEKIKKQQIGANSASVPQTVNNERSPSPESEGELENGPRQRNNQQKVSISSPQIASEPLRPTNHQDKNYTKDNLENKQQSRQHNRSPPTPSNNIHGHTRKEYRPPQQKNFGNGDGLLPNPKAFNQPLQESRFPITAPWMSQGVPLPMVPHPGPYPALYTIGRHFNPYPPHSSTYSPPPMFMPPHPFMMRHPSVNLPPILSGQKDTWQQGLMPLKVRQNAAVVSQKPSAQAQPNMVPISAEGKSSGDHIPVGQIPVNIRQKSTVVSQKPTPQAQPNISPISAECNPLGDYAAEETKVRSTRKEEPTKILRDPRRAELEIAAQEIGNQKGILIPNKSPNVSFTKEDCHSQKGYSDEYRSQDYMKTERLDAASAPGHRRVPEGKDKPPLKGSSFSPPQVLTSSSNSGRGGVSKQCREKSSPEVNPFKYPKDNERGDQTPQRWKSRSSSAENSNQATDSLVRPQTTATSYSLTSIDGGSSSADRYHEGYTPPKNLGSTRKGVTEVAIKHTPNTPTIKEEPFVLYDIPMLVGYSYGDSLFDFYVWSLFGEINNTKFIRDLQNIDQFVPLKAIIKGTYCLARYTDDLGQEGWYRARISKIVEGKAYVYFVDYGNEELLEKTDLAELPSHLRNFSPSAIRLSLTGFEKYPLADNKELDEKFTALIVDKWFRVTISEKVDFSTNEPNLYKAKLEIEVDEKWISLADILVHENLGVKVPCQKYSRTQKHLSKKLPKFTSIDTEIMVMVNDISIKNLNDFYVVPVEKVGLKETITSKLKATESKLEDFLPSRWFENEYLCAVQRNNGQWARAQICSLTRSSELSKEVMTEVRLIDYGETVVVELSKLKMLPEELLGIPQLAYRCSLPLFPKSGAWDDADLKIMQDLAQNQLSDNATEIYVIVFALESDITTHIVEVYIKNGVKGLAKTLKSKSPDTYIEGYDVDYDVRKKLKKQRDSSSAIAPKEQSEKVVSRSAIPMKTQVSVSVALERLETSPTISNNLEHQDSLHTHKSCIELKPSSSNSYETSNISPKNVMHTVNHSLTQNLRNCLGITQDIPANHQISNECGHSEAYLRNSPTVGVFQTPVKLYTGEPQEIQTEENKRSYMSQTLPKGDIAENKIFVLDHKPSTITNGNGDISQLKLKGHNTSPNGSKTTENKDIESITYPDLLPAPSEPLTDAEDVDMQLDRNYTGSKSQGQAQSETNFEVIATEDRCSNVFTESCSTSSLSQIESEYQIKIDESIATHETQTETKTRYSFTVDMIKAPIPLESFDKAVLFRITSFFSFNQAFIIPKTSNSDEFLRLQDELTDCVDSESLSIIPPVGSVAVALFEDKNFYRATIKKIISPEKAEVQLVDLGYSFEVNKTDLKPANNAVMQYPQLGYKVKLKDVEDSPKLLLPSRFKRFIKKAKKYSYKVDECVGETEPYTVSLIAYDEVRTFKVASLSGMILNEQVWDWERLFEKGFRNDTDLLKNGKWNKPATVDDIIPSTLPEGIELEGEISKITEDGYICLVNVKCSELQEDYKVLYNQIERYIDKVAASNFFPIISEVVLVFLKEDIPELKKLNLRGLGRWNRCYRESQDFYRNLDLDELYAIASDHIEVRKLCPEFLVVGVGVIECAIPDFKPSEELVEYIEQRLKSQTLPVKFTVSSFDEENFLHVIHSDNCNEMLAGFEVDMKCELHSCTKKKIIKTAG